jgi:hypothetical protein
MSTLQFNRAMKYLLLLPLVEQGHAILVDEFYFHFARGFAALALLWRLYYAPAGAIVWLEQFRGLESALPIQSSILTLYMIYQAVYWNLIWKAPVTEFEARR